MPEFTKEITIHITDRAYSELKSSMIVKKISGNMYGAQDEVFMKMIKAIENNEQTLDISLKEEREKEKNV